MQQQLRELLRHSGSPSYKAIARHAELQNQRLSISSITNLLKGKGKPRPDTVEAFVVGCTAYAEMKKQPLPLALANLSGWRALYSATYPDLPDAADQLIPDDLREAYRAHMAARYDRLELQALLSPGVTDSIEPWLSQVLVPARVRAALPVVELPREVRQRLAAGLPPSNLPDGLDADLILRTYQAYESQPTRQALEMLADPGEQHVVLLGDPGSGKSVTVRNLTSLLCQGGSATWGPALDGWLPLFVELRVFAAPQWRAGTFVDLLDHLYRTEGLGLPAETLEAYLKQDGRAVIVFDGLDEIFDPELRQTVTRQIAGFAFHYPRTRIVVTSRPVEYQRGPLEAAGFTHYVVQDFNRGEVEQFAQRWCRARKRDDGAPTDDAWRRLMWAYDNSLPVRELSGNPLLLTILAMVNERYVVPLHRRAVFEHAIAVLVDQWDVDKHLGKDSQLRLDRDRKMDLLGAVARTTLRDGGLAGNYISGESLLDEVESYLRTHYEVPTYQARPAAQAIVDEFRERTFIISRFGGNVYGFVHRSFLEYFTAANLVQHLTMDTLDDLYRQNWSRPEWHEVLVLVSGMIVESAAGMAIDRLLSADPIWQFRSERDPQHVLLALRCLGEVRDPDLLPEQGIRLTRALLGVVEAAHRRETEEHDDSLTRSLLQIATPVLEVLGSKWSGHPLYEWWYRTSGRFLPISPAVTASVFAVATRLCAAVSRGVDDVRKILGAEATVSLDPLVRLAAVAGLAAGWSDHPSTVRTIRQCAVVDLDKDVRREALRALANRWPHDQKCQTLLHKRCAEDPNRAVRCTALRAVIANRAGTWELRERIDRLLQHLMKDPDHAVRETAVLGLTTNAVTAPPVHDLIQEYASNDSDAGVRRAALRSLARGWSDDPGTLPLILQRIDADDDPGVRGAGIESLVGNWPDDPQTRAVVEQVAIGDPHWSVRYGAMRALAANWPDHRNSLRAIRGLAFRDRVAPIRALAIQTLATQWPSDTSVPGLLFGRARKDDDWTVRRAAWQALAAIRPRDTRTWTGIRDAINDDPATPLRAAIVHLAARIRPNDAQARSVVLRAAQDPEALVRSAAVRALGTDWAAHPEARAAVDDRAVRDDDHRVRRAALATVGISADLLRERLDSDPHPSVRKVAFLALAKDHDEQSRLLSAIAVGDPDPQLRALAVGTLSDPPTDDPDPLVRAAAVATCPTRTTVHRLATADPDADVRRVALRVLATSWPDDSYTRAALRAAVIDAEAACRQTGLELLTVAEPTDPDTVTVVSDTAATDPDPAVRRTALQLLAADLWATANVGALIRERAIQDPDAEVRLAALTVCVARWPLEPTTLATLHERLAADPDENVREFAVRSLAARYPRHTLTTELLRLRLTGDRSQAVREAAGSLICGTDPPTHWSASLEMHGKGVGVLSVIGEIDMVGAGYLQELVEEAIEAGLIHLVLDLTQATYLDSPGLSVLTRAKNWLDDLGGSLSLAASTRLILRVLNVSGLIEILGTCPTVAEALERQHLPE